MAYQKLQVSEGLSVITSATVRIPDPSTVVVLDIATNKTVGVGSFNTANIAYTVTGITSDTVLTVTPATVGGANDSFTIYTKPTLGCILYVGGTGDLTVQMASKNGNTSAAAQAANHQITYKNIGNAAFLPTQVVRVDASTTATDIIALW